MPAVRTTPKDVLIRVPKIEPYSNRYVPPSKRAQEEAKKLAEAATALAPAPVVDLTSSAPAPVPSTSAAADATVAPAEASTSDEAGKGRTERGNSPTLPFLSTDRAEEQTVELSKAATSSAGWNSLLVWARRQRGAQWDEATALWQVDKYSREYYTFCEDPATTDRSKQPGGEEGGAEAKKEGGAKAEEDEDKGPRASSRNNVSRVVGDETTAGAGTTDSPPPVVTHRSIRILRK